MDGPIKTVWTEKSPVCEVVDYLIDSLWCTKLQASYSTDATLYEETHEQIFIGSPSQDTYNVRLKLEKGTAMVNLLNLNGQLLETEEQTETDSSARKHFSLDMSKLHGQGGIIKVYLKANNKYHRGEWENLILYVLGNINRCRWTEKFPTKTVWTEKI